MTKISSHLRREALVSAAINGVISVGFFIAFFRGIDPIPVWGAGNYAFDFIPQSFAVSLMSALVPGFLARKALASGRFGRVSPPTPSTVLWRALAWAIAGLAAGAGLAAILLWLSGLDAIASAPAFVIKVAYGALLGSIITHRSVGWLILGAAAPFDHKDWQTNA